MKLFFARIERLRTRLRARGLGDRPLHVCLDDARKRRFLVPFFIIFHHCSCDVHAISGHILVEIPRNSSNFFSRFLLTTFASAITVLQHGYEDMKQFSDTMICLSGITLRLFEDDFRDLHSDPLLLTAVFAFITASAILLLNLLIAQLMLG